MAGKRAAPGAVKAKAKAASPAAAAPAQPSMAQSATSAAVGGLCNVLLGQPFDTVKVRLQTQTKDQRVFTGALDCFVKTVRNEGFLALYKGTSGAFVSIMTENIVLLTANTGIKAAMQALHKDESPLSLGELALCGGLAGIFSATAITPAEVVKCRLQVSRSVSYGCDSQLKYTGPLDCVVKTVKTEGVGGLFRGLGSVLARDLPFNFVFLGSYEAVIQAMQQFRGLNTTKDELNSLEILTAGGLAGTIGWAVIFPIDVVKSRLQTTTKQETMLSVARSIFAAEGLMAFYRGCSAALLRAFPANAGLFFGYEMAQRWLFRRDAIVYDVN
uniref:Uncharacterized protein n=1 Tax=Lotharella oceanica TaxID=641309 RepID=A0A7S2U3J7_9EUKA|mmetsp:Transcript_8605/g.16911  ORF Transcript_8605/g.16911 Transcript_8605/m.16911 type:complete len:329 (+) Transcript_8605:204-1190(+)